MKKWIALLLVLVLCLALAACGDSKKKNDDDEDEDEEGEGTTTSTTVTDEEGDGNGEVWGDIVNPGGTQTRLPATKTQNDIAVTDRTYEVATTTTRVVYDEPETAVTTTRQPVVTTRPAAPSNAVAEFVEKYRSQVDSMSGEQMALSLLARGNSVVYVYAYTTIYDYNADMTNAILQSMEAQKDTLATALAGMQEECPQISSIIYEYYTADGDLVASYETK